MRRNKVVKFRASEIELAAMIEKATLAKLSLSAYSRQVIIQGTAISPSVAKEMILAVNRLGNCLNQLAKCAYVSGYKADAHNDTLQILKEVKKACLNHLLKLRATDAR